MSILKKLEKLDKLFELEKLKKLYKLEKQGKLKKLDKLDELDKLGELERLDKLKRLHFVLAEIFGAQALQPFFEPFRAFQVFIKFQAVSFLDDLILYKNGRIHPKS